MAGLLEPSEPTGQFGIETKTITQPILKQARCLKGKLPASPARPPVALGPNRSQLSLGDGIEGQHHLNQPGWSQPHQAAQMAALRDFRGSGHAPGA